MKHCKLTAAKRSSENASAQRDNKREALAAGAFRRYNKRCRFHSAVQEPSSPQPPYQTTAPLCTYQKEKHRAVRQEPPHPAAAAPPRRLAPPSRPVPARPGPGTLEYSCASFWYFPGSSAAAAAAMAPPEEGRAGGRASGLSVMTSARRPLTAAGNEGGPGRGFGRRRRHLDATSKMAARGRLARLAWQQVTRPARAHRYGAPPRTKRCRAELRRRRAGRRQGARAPFWGSR